MLYFALMAIFGNTPKDDASLALQNAHGLFTQAQHNYLLLQTGDALERLTNIERGLEPFLDHAAAGPLLAKSLRLRFLVELFLGESTLAEQSLHKALLLEPQFMPNTEEWSPEAQRFFQATRKKQQERPSGIVTISIVPPDAQIWLDGFHKGQGRKTLSAIQPGEHFLLATHAHFRRFVGRIDIKAHGVLTDVGIFLEPLGEPNPAPQVLNPALGPTGASPPWYTSLKLWGIVGSVLVVGSGSLWLATQDRQSKQVTLVLGTSK